MFCPRCKIETQDTFCEYCGSATVASSEVAATSTEAKTQHFQESIRHDGNTIAAKFSLKKIISFVAVLVLIIGGLTTYKALQAQYTPKKTVEKFYDYLIKKDYDNAYKMLINTDDRFMTKDNFKLAMEQKDIKQYYIKDFNINEFQNYEDSSTANIRNLKNMFSVQASGKLYPISVAEDGSKLIFFKDYKIDASTFAVKWQMIAPQGAKISINGVEPDISDEPNYDNNMLYNTNYKPSTLIYQVDRIFQGSYDIVAKLDGAEDIKLSSAQAGKKVTIKFSPSADTLKKLQEQAKAYLDLYYSKATQDKYTSLLTTDSKAISRIGGIFGGFNYSSDYVTNKLQELKITSSQLDDIDHATVNVKGSVYYEDSSLLSWYGSKQTGTRDMETEFYFERVNGNWLICDTGYIN